MVIQGEFYAKKTTYILHFAKKWKSEFIKQTEELHLRFFICLTLHIVLKIQAKKFQKKWRANILFGSAVIWAEMAADHEND